MVYINQHVHKQLTVKIRESLKLVVLQVLGTELSRGCKLCQNIINTLDMTLGTNAQQLFVHVCGRCHTACGS